MIAPDKKSYVVSVIAYADVVVIDAESEEKAMEYALDALSLGDMEMDEASVKEELKTEEDIERAKRHAQAVSEDE